MKINYLEDYVFEILRNDELSRRDDCYLILKVIEKLYPYEIGNKFNAKNKGISFESITRCRRKLQKKYPELKDEKISNLRNQKQKEYIDYSKTN